MNAWVHIVLHDKVQSTHSDSANHIFLLDSTIFFWIGWKIFWVSSPRRALIFKVPDRSDGTLLPWWWAVGNFSLAGSWIVPERLFFVLRYIEYVDGLQRSFTPVKGSFTTSNLQPQSTFSNKLKMWMCCISPFRNRFMSRGDSYQIVSFMRWSWRATVATTNNTLRYGRLSGVVGSTPRGVLICVCPRYRPLVLGPGYGCSRRSYMHSDSH